MRTTTHLRESEKKMHNPRKRWLTVAAVITYCVYLCWPQIVQVYDSFNSSPRTTPVATDVPETTAPCTASKLQDALHTTRPTMQFSCRHDIWDSNDRTIAWTTITVWPDITNDLADSLTKEVQAYCDTQSAEDIAGNLHQTDDFGSITGYYMHLCQSSGNYAVLDTGQYTIRIHINGTSNQGLNETIPQLQEAAKYVLLSLRSRWVAPVV